MLITKHVLLKTVRPTRSVMIKRPRRTRAYSVIQKYVHKRLIYAYVHRGCGNVYKKKLPFPFPTKITLKGKVRPRTDHEGPDGEYRYSSTLSLTSALEGGGLLTPRPGRFTPRKEKPYPLYRRLVGPQGRSGRVRKISSPPGFDPRTVQPVASCYTD